MHARLIGGFKALNACHQRVKRVENRMENDLISETERHTLADLLERCALSLGESDD
jgi:hypothetical protein